MKSYSLAEDISNKDLLGGEDTTYYEFCKEDKKSDKPAKTMANQFKLGEKVGSYGIRYFGQEGKSKKGHTAMFICHCGKDFRQTIYLINANEIKSCGCLRGSGVKMKKEK